LIDFMMARAHHGMSVSNQQRCGREDFPTAPEASIPAPTRRSPEADFAGLNLGYRRIAINGEFTRAV
jgi:hypothetical protein